MMTRLTGNRSLLSAAAGFHGDLRGRELFEDLRAVGIDSQNRPVLVIDTMQGEDVLDVSMPMRLCWVMDASGLGCSQPQDWHAMPWGRPHQQ